MANHDQLVAAIDAAKSTPEDFAAWDAVESLAGDLDAPDPVAEAYREAIGGDLDHDTVLELGLRAAQFHEEWYADDPSGLIAVLSRMLQVDPESVEAFQRLTVVLTVAERWDDLLSLYDDTIDAVSDAERKQRLLDEAAQVAKDVAGRPEKAIGYLQRLLPLRPGDNKLAQNLERLLERHERWRELIALWEQLLSDQKDADREETRLRIATCWMDNLDEPAQALEASRPLLAEASDDRAACALVERILQSDADESVRDGALSLLRSHYEATARHREIVRVIEVAIERADGQRLRELHEEAAERLADLGDDAAATEHYAALLALAPMSSVVQEQLRQLAQRSGNYEAYAQGVAAAAEACNDVSRRVHLLAEAARTRLDYLEDEAGAIELLKHALEQDGIASADVRVVARRLSELLASADRPAERLDVLERLAGAENAEARKRAVLGDAARLAESLGEIDRALAAWNARISIDANDHVAVNGVIALLERAQRWEPLIGAIEQRLSSTTEAGDRKGDLSRIAAIYDSELSDTERAIEAWMRVQRECGEDSASTDALVGLLDRVGRHQELADLLERASTREVTLVSERLTRLADTRRAHLGAPGDALEAYRRLLLMDSRHEGARAGLTELLEDEGLRDRAAIALATSYRDNGEWTRFLELVEPRLAQARSDGEKLAILREAAEIREQQLDDTAGALEAIARAMPLAPRDARLEEEMVRLARATGSWDAAVSAYRAAAEALGDDPYVAHLKLEEARILERELERGDEAYAAYRAVAAIEPHHLEAASAVARLGCAAGAWDQVAGVVMAYTRARKAIDEDLFSLMIDAAGETGAWDAMVGALERELEAGDVPPMIAFELWRRAALWHRDQRDDRDAAKRAFLRALSFDPAQPETLRALAELQKDTPDRAYFATLMSLVDSDPANLVDAHAAAQVAIGLDDAELARQTVTTVLGRAAAAWRAGEAGAGDESPEQLVSWALGRLVDDHLANGRHAAAIDLLVDAARMPFSTEVRRELRERAATIASESGDVDSAIEMYRAVVAMAPDNAESIERLARLYEAQNRVAELLTLRKHELGLVSDPDRRLSLRLEVARLVGEVERTGGRLEALRQNLTERPGHEASIEALVHLLDASAQHGSLADMLEEQATKLEAMDEGDRAGGLWQRAAEIARTELGDAGRAIEDYRRSVALVPAFDKFDALARLHLGREQAAQAVPWLERCLQTAPAEQTTQVVLDLAHAHLAADQRAQAIAALEHNIPDDRPAFELRELLADLYRQSQSWEPLARLLTRSLSMLGASDQGVAYAREAAEIYADRLNMPDKAVPALQTALELDPDDRSLKIKLAVGMRVAGQLDESREILTQLVKKFGRRKSAERAGVHVELALVAKAEGNSDEALAELERASKMDAGNPRILKMVADLYVAQGQLDDAEKTLRALLLLVRRQPPGDDISTVGTSEILYELHRIAGQRDDGAEQASELLESALEAATKSDAEVRRLRRALDAAGDAETLLKALEMRLDVAEETESRASLLADLAEVLDGKLHRSAEALDAQLRAIDLIPDRMELHDRARELSVKAAEVQRYVDCVDRTVEKLRRKKDAPLVATLLLKAGASLENDAGDLPRALAVYQRVEGTGEHTAEALFAIARVAGVIGDDAERGRALDSLLALATTGEQSPEQIDALYRMAELFVVDDARRAQGIDLLAQAFTAEPRFTEAGATLQAAADREPENPDILTLYEKVARGGSDWEMLLDFLERRARLPGATPAEVKEAVDLAVEHDQRERGEALLERAVEAARASVEGLGGAVWAAVALAEQKTAAGDVAGARELLFEIADVADPDRVAELGLRIAERAADDADTRELAASIYEMLREREPAARHIWEPLVALYRTMGDHGRVQATIAATLPNLVEPAERNALRLANAQHLIEGVGDREAAVEVLRDLLLDDPDHLEGAALLESVLRESGDQEGLADFLWQRFEDAKERRNPDTVIDVAQRLGRLLDEMGSFDAASVYQQALEIAPDSRELLREVIAHQAEETDARERAELMERQLAVETGADAVTLTQSLAELRQSLSDEDGVQRALELGFRAAPDDQDIRNRLEGWYRERQQWKPLAEMMAADAERLSDEPPLAVARLREAAEVYREMLADPVSASGLLQRARRLMPTNDGLVSELVNSLLMAGEHQQASIVLDETLQHDLPHDARVTLLLTRSGLRASLDQLGGSVEDLEEAYLLNRDLVAPELMDGLDRYRAHCEFNRRCRRRAGRHPAPGRAAPRRRRDRSRARDGHRLGPAQPRRPRRALLPPRPQRGVGRLERRAGRVRAAGPGRERRRADRRRPATGRRRRARRATRSGAPGSGDGPSGPARLGGRARQAAPDLRAVGGLSRAGHAAPRRRRSLRRRGAALQRLPQGGGSVPAVARRPGLGHGSGGEGARAQTGRPRHRHHVRQRPHRRRPRR